VRREEGKRRAGASAGAESGKHVIPANTMSFPRTPCHSREHHVIPAKAGIQDPCRRQEGKRLRVRKEVKRQNEPELVTLGLGAGGRASSDFVRMRLAPLFGGLDLEDAAIIKVNGPSVAFTTDSFVVDPLFFPGGDIGRLAVFGTVNDLAVRGAAPAWLSLGVVAAEGFPMSALMDVMKSVGAAAREAGVRVVTGDTKVVDRESLNGLILNTAGIGDIISGARVSADRVRAGDAVVVSGPIGAHELAVLSSRHGLGLGGLLSDCAPISVLTAGMVKEFGHGVKWMRDPTRGGLATVLNEFAAAQNAAVAIDENAVPIDDNIRDAADILGLDPFYLACEGRFVAIVDKSVAAAVVGWLHRAPGGRAAAEIGSVVTVGPDNPKVELYTKFGSRRILRYLAADQQPRIC